MSRKSDGRGSTGSSGRGRDSTWAPDARGAPIPWPARRTTFQSPGADSLGNQCSSAVAAAFSAAARAVASSRVIAQAYAAHMKGAYPRPVSPRGWAQFAVSFLRGFV